MADSPLIPAGQSTEAPAPTLPWQPGQARPLDPEALTQWNARIERSAQVRKQYEPQWERALKRYAEAKVNTQKTDINALLDYRHVESKKSGLFHRTPELTLLPIDPKDQTIPYDAVLPLRQKFLNYELGPKAANAKRAVHKTLIDALAASGWMICEVGFEQVSLPLETTEPGMLGQPATTTTIQVPIWARRFIADISSMKLLVPDEFTDSSNFDAAPWLAIRGTISIAKAKRAGWTIPEGTTGSSQQDEYRYKHGDAPQAATDALLEYTKIWYRAAEYDESVFNPELFRCLVLVKGVEAPVWHVDSPYQALTPQGQLTDDSLIGNPIHVGTLRDLIDSAYVPSDLVVGEQLSVELNKFRTGLTSNRKQRSPIVLVSDAAGPDTAEKIIKDHAAVVPAQHIQPGGSQDLVVVVQSGTEPRDNYTAQQIIENDHDQALGQSSNQRGTLDAKKRTATEIRTVQGNANAREETEKDRIRDYFVALARKFDVIVQRTATQQDVLKVLGQQGAMLWEQWRMLPGKYAYDILPDSGKYVDAREYLTHTLDTYNLLRKDERVNVEELLAMVARALNRDPAKFINPPQDKTIEPPKISVSINLIDLNDPVAGRMALDLLANEGVKVSPDTIALMKAAHVSAVVNGTAGMRPGTKPVGADAGGNGHGGSADRTEPVNKHQTQKTGGMQGVAA